MDNKLVATLSEDETEIVRRLFMRKKALEELLNSIDPNNEVLYNRIIADLVVANDQMTAWWENASQKNQWKFDERSKWLVNFATREIFIANY